MRALLNPDIDDKKLFAEVEELIRLIPPAAELLSVEHAPWRGRVPAVLARCTTAGDMAVKTIFSRARTYDLKVDRSVESDLIALLHEARYNLLLDTGHSTSVAIDKGATFHYFDELSQRIKSAKNDIFFVDPYLDGEFVSNYLGHVGSGVTTRLLGKNKKELNTLVPAAKMFMSQHGGKIEVREAKFHDRFVIIDGRTGYQSGASFKDGGKHAPTALVEVVDVFSAVHQQYESMWAAATPHI